jgi:aryl-alcohol dehydrogenase-like predicted oxidoreductase
METVTIAKTGLGDAGLEISRVGLGSWAIGGWMWGGSDEAGAVRAIQAAVDHGVTLIDTAPVYGQGLAEELVGRAVDEAGLRHKVVLATKVGLEWREGGRKVFRNATAARITEEIEDSLRRLRTDVIDIYQVHWPDEHVPAEETATALRGLLEAGKIRAIGVSNYSPAQMDAFAELAPLHTTQPPYNLFERGADADVLPYCVEHGVVSLTYGVLCRGLLSGKISAERSFAPGDLRRFDPKLRRKRLPQYLAAVERLAQLARERHDRSVLALAVRWALQQPGVGSVLWGVRRPEQLAPVAEAFGWQLSATDLVDIDRIVAEEISDPVGAEFMTPGHRPELAPGE